MDLSYYQLRAFLYDREHELSASLILQELEQVWFCSRKNVKRKLKAFEQAGIFTYEPGRGRGHLSQVWFNQPFQKEIMETVEQLIQEEQLESLMQLLQLPIPKSWVAAIFNEVEMMFGLQSPDADKDILRSIVTRKLTTLDPIYTSITFESYLLYQLGDTLVTYDPAKDQIGPQLAHHWIVDDYHRNWTFYLRKGVRFHHQRVLTSEDVRYTFERFNEGRSPNDWLLQDIEYIECPSPYVVTFQLKRSNPFFLRYLSSNNLVILPRDVPFDEYEWVGTGPFKLKERSESQLVLEAFDDYFLERPILDQVEFWQMTTNPLSSATFQIDGEKETEDVQKKEDIELGFRFLAFNFNQPSIVHEGSFREAIYHLLDMKRMFADLGRKDLIEASSYFYWKAEPPLKDRSRVGKLLEAANYEGQTLKLYSLDYPKAIEEAKWFVHEARSVGLSLEHRTFSLDEFYSPSIEQDADLLFMGEVASNDLHLSFLGAFYNEALIFRRFLGAEHLAWIEAQLEELKREDRAIDREKWMDRVENYLQAEHLIIFKYHPIRRRTFHSMIRDIRFEAFGQIDLRRLWVP